MKPTSRLLNLSEACARLGIGRSTLYSLMSQGVIPRPVKLGSASRWPEAEIDDVILGFVAKRDGREAV